MNTSKLTIGELETFLLDFPQNLIVDWAPGQLHIKNGRGDIVAHISVYEPKLIHKDINTIPVQLECGHIGTLQDNPRNWCEKCIPLLDGTCLCCSAEKDNTDASKTE